MSGSILGSVLPAMQIPDQIAFTIGRVSIYWYGILLTVAILIALFFTQSEVRRIGLAPDTALDLCLIIIPCGIIGARIWYVISLWDRFSANPALIFQLTDGGLSVYGALLFSLVGVCIYVLCKKISLLRLCDAFFPGLILAQAILRWGDFFNQTGFGPAITNPSMQWFPYAVLIERSDTIHAAVFFYEFLWCVAIFLLLWFFVRKNARREGMVAATYLVLFSIGHIVFEGLRQDAVLLYGSIRTAQAVCVVTLLIGLGIWLFSRRKIDASASPSVTDSDAEQQVAGDDGAAPVVEADLGAELGVSERPIADEPPAEGTDHTEDADTSAK